MTTILPQGELMRRAVTWIDGQRAETGQSYPRSSRRPPCGSI